MKKNKFIVVEGLEGSGKTHACIYLKKILQEKNIKNIVLVRQPGSTIIAEEIRKIIKKDFHTEQMIKETELLLMYAARVQLVTQIIKPELEKGTWVISDRHDLSSLAYQSGGLGIDPKLIIQLKNLLLGSFIPDLTIYLDVIPEIGLKRASKRGVLDKIEKRSLDFFNKTRNSYLHNIKLDQNSIIINANVDVNNVNQNMQKKVLQWLKEQSL